MQIRISQANTISFSLVTNNPFMMLSKAFSSRILMNPSARSLVARGFLSSIPRLAAAAAAATAIHHPDVNDSPSHVQHALLEAVISCSTEPLSSSRRDLIYQRLQHLPTNTCPDKLDFTDDRTTLVIPTSAFEPQQDASFASFLDQVVGNHDLNDDSFWKTFALFYKCPRVVRAGASDNNASPEHVLWPPSK